MAMKTSRSDVKASCTMSERIVATSRRATATAASFCELKLNTSNRNIHAQPRTKCCKHGQRSSEQPDSRWTHECEDILLRRIMPILHLLRPHAPLCPSLWRKVRLDRLQSLLDLIESLRGPDLRRPHPSLPCRTTPSTRFGRLFGRRIHRPVRRQILVEPVWRRDRRDGA